MTVGGGKGGGDEDDPKKRHNIRQSGRKADKKKAKKNANYRQVEDGDDDGGKGGEEGEKTAKLAPDPVRNPKAFAFNNVKKLEKKFRRTADIKEKRKRLPDVDRTPLEPPPFVVALVGPPKVRSVIYLWFIVW